MEAKIVGADDAFPQCLCLIYFIEGHGYAVEELKFQQDNMSATLMEKNGKDSIKNQTKHIQA